MCISTGVLMYMYIIDKYTDIYIETKIYIGVNNPHLYKYLYL